MHFSRREFVIPPFVLGVVIFILLIQSIACERRAVTAAKDKSVVTLLPSHAGAVLSVVPDARIVGASRYTEWPPEVRPVAFLPMPAPLEEIVRLQPGLVLVHPADGRLASSLTELGIPVLLHGMDSLEEIDATLLDIGRHFGVPEKADSVVRELHRQLEDAIPANLPEQIRGGGEGRGFRVLLIIDAADSRMQRLFVAQNHAFLAELAGNCGAEVVSSGAGDWGMLTAEQLVRLAPDGILYFSGNAELGVINRTQFTKTYSELDAVRGGRVVYLTDSALSQPDIRIPRTQRILCEAIRDAARALPDRQP